MNFNLNGLSNLGKAALAFGKKNKTSLMVGGGVGLGWLSLILMMIEAPKAAKKVEEENKQRKEDDLNPMSKTEVAIQYAKDCAPAIVSQIGSTVLHVMAQKENLDTIGSWIMLSQLYKSDGEKLRKQILKDGGQKKLDEYDDKIFAEDHPVEEIIEYPEYKERGNKTLIFDETTRERFSRTMTDLRNGFEDYNQMMYNRYMEAYKQKYGEELKDAFFSKDGNPFPIDDTNIYVTSSIDEFLVCIGEKDPHSPKSDFGEIGEIRYDGNGPAADFNKLVVFKDFVDPESGKVVYARIKSLLKEGLLWPAYCYDDWRPGGRS